MGSWANMGYVGLLLYVRKCLAVCQMAPYSLYSTLLLTKAHRELNVAGGVCVTKHEENVGRFTAVEVERLWI